MSYITEQLRVSLNEKLGEFLNFPYADTENISKDCYELAQAVIQYSLYEPQIFITRRKTVQFEFEKEKSYLEIEVFDDRYEIYQNDEENGIKKEFHKSVKTNELFEIFNIIKIFYKGNPQNSVLFTGAFNPIHIGHYHMIESALNKGFDYVIFAVSNQQFLDKKAKNSREKIVFNEEQRLQMLFQSTYLNPNVLIFGVEQGYTYNVLCSVKDKYKMSHLYFAMGSDKLKEIERWGFHDRLLSEFSFYVLLRNDNGEDTKRKCDEIFKNTSYIIGVDNDEFKDISSTKVRELIKSHKSYKGYVPNGVENLISGYLCKGYSN